MKKLYDEIVHTFYNNGILFTQKGLVPPGKVALIEEQPLELPDTGFTTPVLFVDYRIEWKRYDKESREGALLLDCHLFAGNYSVTEAIDNPIERNQKRLDYYELVKMLIEDIYVDETNRLTLESEEFLHDTLCRCRRFRFSSLINREIIHNYIPIRHMDKTVEKHRAML